MSDYLDKDITKCKPEDCSSCSGCDQPLTDHSNDFDFSDGNATVTLELDNGEIQECAIVAIYPAGDREYIALLPLNDQGENEDGEVYLYRFLLEDGTPSLDNIASEEEYETASEGFDQWLSDHEFDDLVYEDVDEETD